MFKSNQIVMVSLYFFSLKENRDFEAQNLKQVRNISVRPVKILCQEVNI